MPAWPYGAIEGVDVTCDTRQQAGKHAHVDAAFDAMGLTHAYAKLDFGDYMRPGSNVSVDTKQHIEELASNLGRDHERFRRECERARDAGYRLVVLVEGMGGVEDLPGLAAWFARRCSACRIPCGRESCRLHRVTPARAASLVKSMATMRRKYGVEFMFCDRSETALVIARLLGLEERCLSSATRR